MIHLGFEVGTGEPVTIPLDHLIITGRTRASGKTTTLEAIAARSGFKVLTFLTKPGEDTFSHARTIRPYFHDEGGWRFVASILEATLGERLKQERAEIINATKGARSLREVYQRILDRKMKVKSGFVLDILTRLEAYFEIVLPQIEKTPFAQKLEIREGANVIDMSSHDYSDELQSLVIRSALGWVLKHEKGVLTVIPEAWKFIPEKRGNPVKDGCATLIRQGGVHQNWVAIDSQEITSVDAGIRKSIGTWILGVQREVNEVARVIDQLPGKPKPSADDVMQLGLGQFYVSYANAPTRKVYVQPAWMETETARTAAIAGTTGQPWIPKPMAELVPFIVAQFAQEETGLGRTAAKLGRMVGVPAAITESEDDEMASEDVRRLEGKLDELMEFVRRGNAAQSAVDRALPAAPIAGHLQDAAIDDEEGLFQRFKARFLKEPEVLKVLTSRPEIQVEVRTETITMDGSTLPGRLARLIAADFFKEPKRHADTKRELERTGPQVHNGNLSRELKGLMHKGFLTDESDGYVAVPGMKVHIVRK